MATQQQKNKLACGLVSYERLRPGFFNHKALKHIKSDQLLGVILNLINN